MSKCLPMLSLVLVFCLTTFFPVAAGAQELQEDIDKMVSLVVEAWNNRDPEALAGLFTEDADLRDQDGQWITGRGEIQGYFEEWMAGSDGAKEVLVERGRLLAEGAAVVDVVSAVVPEGGSFWGEGTERFAISVNVLQQRDGSWSFASWRQCHGPK